MDQIDEIRLIQYPVLPGGGNRRAPPAGREPDLLQRRVVTDRMPDIGPLANWQVPVRSCGKQTLVQVTIRRSWLAAGTAARPSHRIDDIPTG
jgi:hypothetical protein